MDRIVAEQLMAMLEGNNLVERRTAREQILRKLIENVDSRRVYSELCKNPDFSTVPSFDMINKAIKDAGY